MATRARPQIATAPTLLVSTMSLPAAKSLTEAARSLRWHVKTLTDRTFAERTGKLVYYGGTDKALEVVKRFHVALLEPPFDLLAKLPIEFRRRTVEYASFGDLARLHGPTFVKPADALNKSFDAGIYSSVREIRTPHGIDPRTPVLLAEPVEWSAEYRCFILDGALAAWSPYISFGRPSWKPFAKGTLSDQPPPSIVSFCKRLFTRPASSFPPAFVMDVGLVDDRGWAVVEFNPVWCSGLLGADPVSVLPVLDRACQDSQQLDAHDRAWVIEDRIDQ